MNGWPHMQLLIKKPPKKPPSLAEVYMYVAILGGYVKRKNSSPGIKNTWIGIQRLHDIARGWEIANVLI